MYCLCFFLSWMTVHKSRVLMWEDRFTVLKFCLSSESIRPHKQGNQCVWARSRPGPAANIQHATYSFVLLLFPFFASFVLFALEDSFHFEGGSERRVLATDVFDLKSYLNSYATIHYLTGFVMVSWEGSLLEPTPAHTREKHWKQVPSPSQGTKCIWFKTFWTKSSNVLQ